MCVCVFCIIRLSENNRPFEARIAIPRLTIRAKYTSSGVLLIIPASGSGDFDAVLDGVVADLKGQVSTKDKEGKTFLHVDSLAMELNVKKVRMHIAKVFKNNRILSKYSNSIGRNEFEMNSNFSTVFLRVFSLQPKQQISSCVKTALKYCELCNLNYKRNYH